MTVKLLSKQHLEFLIYQAAAQAYLSLFMSKCHIVGNHVRAHCSNIVNTFSSYSQIECWLSGLEFTNACQNSKQEDLDQTAPTGPV